ncbi:MAG: GNAT family N-acetyltransferase [Gammaproteobacteria bacterium]|nr:GNAT family N-acetyltransferase [Gammaproteobacteria bacterium]
MRGFDGLSARSRQLRFFSPLNGLSNAQLTYLTEIDNVNHVAIAAFVEKDGDTTPVGLARYIRLAQEPQVAEFAITVVDAFQGRGVGSSLLAALMDHARGNGVGVLRGYVLSANEPMIRMLQRRGAHATAEADGTLRFDLRLRKQNT